MQIDYSMCFSFLILKYDFQSRRSAVAVTRQAHQVPGACGPAAEGVRGGGDPCRRGRFRLRVRQPRARESPWPHPPADVRPPTRRPADPPTLSLRTCSSPEIPPPFWVGPLLRLRGPLRPSLGVPTGGRRWFWVHPGASLAAARLLPGPQEKNPALVMVKYFRIV